MKTIQIGEDTYRRLKDYCQESGLIIWQFADSAISYELFKEEEKKTILDSYKKAEDNFQRPLDLEGEDKI